MGAGERVLGEIRTRRRLRVRPRRVLEEVERLAGWSEFKERFEALEEQKKARRREVLEEAARLAIEEKVDAEATGEESDRAYNRACEDIAAVFWKMAVSATGGRI